MISENLISWETHEYEYREKHPNWYVAFAIIIISLSVTAYLLDNFLFGILIILSGVSLFMYAKKESELLKCSLDKRGLRINNKLYPYQTLESFWVTPDDENPKLIIQSEKILAPYIILPLKDLPSEDVRDFLLAFLEEEEHFEPISHRIMEHLGF